MPEAMAQAMVPLSKRGYGSQEMLMVEALDDTIAVASREINIAVMRAVAMTRIGIVIQHTTQPASTVMHLQEELHSAGMLASHQAEWLKEFLRQCRGRGLGTPQEEWLDIWFHHCMSLRRCRLCTVTSARSTVVWHGNVSARKDLALVAGNECFKN